MNSGAAVVTGRQGRGQLNRRSERVIAVERRGGFDNRRFRPVRNYQKRYFRKNHSVNYIPVHHNYYVQHNVRVRPRIHIEVDWPWKYRYRRHWKPHYQYRQVVNVYVGNARHWNNARVELRTRYHQELRYADDNKAEIDIYIDAIEIYDNGYFIGEVTRIPERLSRIGAVVYRDGEIRYDRDVFLVGDPGVGFEMISTRSYGNFVYSDYRRNDGFRVGRLDLRRGKVRTRRNSRLFDPYGYKGYAPISLLPENEHELFDFGLDAISYYYHDEYDPYYGGYYDDVYADDEYGYAFDSRSNPDFLSYSSAAQVGGNPFELREATEPVQVSYNNEYQLRNGQQIRYERQGELQRIK